MSEADERKEKQQWAIDKPKLDNARNLRGFYSVDPDDGELQGSHEETHGKSWRFRWKLPCTLRTKKRPNKLLETDNETKGSNNINKRQACMHRGGS